MNRRQFLQALAATSCTLSLPLGARAATGSGLRFVFVFNEGGWDPTRVFAPEFDNSNVDMEPLAERATVGDLTWVDHPERAVVRSFFETYGHKALVINGVLVRSIAHEICTVLAMTGTVSGAGGDWPAKLAGATPDYTMPHLVLGGPSYPGDLGSAVARAGGAGQLDALLSGDIASWSDDELFTPSANSENLVDRYLLTRVQAELQGASTDLERSLYGELDRSARAAMDLKGYRYVMDFSTDGGLTAASGVAVDALAEGLCRCVTLGYGGGEWDSHVNNDLTQSQLFNGLFTGLAQLLQSLETTPTDTGTLADDTVVVVLSEMGRTPLLNGFDGKDHWPYTSVMLLGPGITGGRVIGGFDESYYGLGVDPASGEVDETGPIVSAGSVGATLLALAGLDPAEHVSDALPITGALI